MRPISIAAVVGVLATAVAPLARAADTPQKTYDHYVDCTSHMMAFQIAMERMQSKEAAEKARGFDPMVKLMRDKAIAAGKTLSVPPDRVSAQIDQGRDRLVRGIPPTVPTHSKEIGQEIALPALSCELDELGKKIAERKAQQAARPAQPAK